MAARTKGKPARRPATAADLLKKPARTREVTFRSTDDSGDPVELVLVLRAVGAKQWDDLVADCPPSADQKKEGALYDVAKFAPRLVSACSYTPLITQDEAEEIFASDSWNNWETQSLFLAAARLCNQDFDVPFTDSASGETPAST
jgi:hypothetical protein